MINLHFGMEPDRMAEAVIVYIRKYIDVFTDR